MKLMEKTLNQFSQIVLELHGLPNTQRAQTFLSALQKLNATHQVVHVHANNNGRLGKCENLVLPSLLEVTCLRKSSYKFVPSEKHFPTNLDQKNIRHKPEIILGRW